MVDQLQINIKFNSVLCQKPNNISIEFNCVSVRLTMRYLSGYYFRFRFHFLASFFSNFILSTEIIINEIKKYGFVSAVHTTDVHRKKLLLHADDTLSHKILFLFNFSDGKNYLRQSKRNENLTDIFANSMNSGTQIFLFMDLNSSK